MISQESHIEKREWIEMHIENINKMIIYLIRSYLTYFVKMYLHNFVYCMYISILNYVKIF